MIFSLMIWFILTRNTEMSFIMENIYPVKGTFPSNRMKSEDNSNEDNSYETHLKSKRKMLISPFTPARNPRSRTNSFSDWNENFKMPFSEQDKLIKTRNPSTLAADQVVHKPKYLPLPPFLQPKKAKPFQDFSKFMKEISHFTPKLPIEGRILSKYNQQVKNFFLTPPNQSGLDTPVQQDFPKDLAQASSVRRRVINEPKYLPLPLFLQPKKAKPFPDFSTSKTEIRRFTPKLPSERRILPEYEQPVKSVVISFLTPPKQHVVPVQNIMSKQDVPRDLPQTSSVRQAINEPKYLTLPPFYKFTKSKMFQESSASVKTNFVTSKFPHGRTTLLEYKQPATNIFIPSSTPPSRFELTRPAQNDMSEQENVFEDKSRTAKSFPNILSERTTLLEYKQPATNIFIPSSTPPSHFELTIPAQNDMYGQKNSFQDKSKPAKPFPNILSERITLLEYKERATNIFIPSSTPPSRFELTIPAQTDMYGQENSFQDKSKPAKPFPNILSERTTLLEYKQPATNIFIPTSTPPSRFELTIPAQNDMYEQENSFQDKSKPAKPFPNILSERTTLLEYKQPATNIFIPSSTPPSHFELTRPAQNYVLEQENLSEDESKAVKNYIDIPSNRATLYEYKQTAANIFIPNPTSPNLSEFTAPAQNTVSKQENVFEDELKTEKPFLVGFPDVNKKIPSPFEAFKNPTLQQQSETVQGQNRLAHISKTMPFNMPNAKKYSKNEKNIPLNVTNARMYSQYDKNFKTYNRTPSSPSSIGMNSTEMSSLQYLHHKLKQAKDIHDRLGSNTKILMWLIAAVLVIVILILILTSIYRHYKDKKKKKYPFQKKNFTLLRATREQQKDILNRIGKIKYSKLTEEDFEE